MIRNAIPTDFPVLKKLWMDSFLDSKEYVDHFFQCNKSRFRFQVLEENREVVGMVCLLPCSISPNHPAYYWYAATIREDKRGCGRFRKFVLELMSKNASAGYRNLCVPVKHLIPFYQSCGFSYAYFTEETTIDLLNESVAEVNCNTKAAASFSCATVRDYQRIQENLPFGSVIWDECHLSYAFSENSFCGGNQVKILIDGNEYFACITKIEDQILIENTNLTKEVLFCIASDLKESYHCKKIRLRREGATDEGTIFGLSDFPMEKNAVLRFALS